MLERSIAIVKDANTVPEFGLLSSTVSRAKRTQDRNEPWDLVSDKALADRLHRPVEGLPS